MLTSIKKNLIYLILFLAAFIRFYQIGTLPSLNPDEAALGYNAYSLLKTGKDEHGISWPLHFKSFGDYKPGGYVYLALPFVKVFGLTPFAVRLPNLILSVLTIYFLYRLVLLLSNFKFQISNFIAFALAVSPWHIHFSRGAWESSAALFFIIAGLYFFYSFLKFSSSYLLLVTSIFFAASLYLYHSARLITPLLVLFLLISNFKFLISNFNKLIYPIIIGLFLTIPVVVSFMNNGGSTRFSGVGLSADLGPLNRAEELMNHHGDNSLYTRIVHNRRVLIGLSWFQKYLSHYDLNFLFLNGDEVPRSRSPDMGQLYLIEFPLILFGIIFLLKNNKQFSSLLLITSYLLLVTPMASSLTFQAPSALRSLPLSVPLAILSGSGLYYIYSITYKYRPHNLFLLAVLYILSFYYFADAYLIHAPRRYPFAWNTGFKELTAYIARYGRNYDHIYVTNQYDQPYILYLFYSRYNPGYLHPQIKLTPPDRFGFSTVPAIDNITFHIPPWSEIPSSSLIFAADELPEIPVKNTIDFPNGEPAFKIYHK